MSPALDDEAAIADRGGRVSMLLTGNGAVVAKQEEVLQARNDK